MHGYHSELNDTTCDVDARGEFWAVLSSHI